MTGADLFAAVPPEVTIVEVGPRDGLQNEPTPGPGRRQGGADRGPGRRRAAGRRGGCLRLAEMGAADGRQRRGAATVSGAGPACAIRCWCRTSRDWRRRWPPGPTRSPCSAPPRRPSRRGTSTARSPRAWSGSGRWPRRRWRKDVRVRGYVSCVLGCPYEGEIAPGAVARVADGTARHGLLRDLARRHDRRRHATQDGGDAGGGHGRAAGRRPWPSTPTTPTARRWPTC